MKKRKRKKKYRDELAGLSAALSRLPDRLTTKPVFYLRTPEGDQRAEFKDGRFQVMDLSEPNRMLQDIRS